MEYEHLLCTVEDRIGWITLNRPEKLNAINRRLWKELRCGLEKADANANVSVLVLTGSGRAFSAGDDIADLTALSDPEIAQDLFMDCIYRFVDCLLQLRKPLIAAVNGLAYGGGCELVLLSDLAVASSEASFAQPEPRLGAVPPIFAVYGPLVLGLKAACEISMSAEPISAQRAWEVGLVNRITAPSALGDVTRQLARQIMKSSPASLRFIKETVHHGLRRHLYDFYIVCQRFQHEVSKTADFHEGVRAFLGKGHPNFKGC